MNMKGGTAMPDTTTLELFKQLPNPRRKVTIMGKRMTLRQHWNSTNDKNYRYNVRLATLQLLGYDT